MGLDRPDLVEGTIDAFFAIKNCVDVFHRNTIGKQCCFNEFSGCSVGFKIADNRAREAIKALLSKGLVEPGGTTAPHPEVEVIPLIPVIASDDYPEKTKPNSDTTSKTAAPEEQE